MILSKSSNEDISDDILNGKGCLQSVCRKRRNFIYLQEYIVVQS